MLLDDRPAGDLILFVKLLFKRADVGRFVGGDLFIGGAAHRAGRDLVRGDPAAGPADIGEGFNGFPRREAGGDFAGLLFPHAVAQKIRARIEKDRRADPVVPIVVVREPPKRRLDPAEDDGTAGIGGLCGF